MRVFIDASVNAATAAPRATPRKTVQMRYSMNELRDRIHTAKAAGAAPDPAEEAEWSSLHGLSVKLNVAVLCCGFVLLFLVIYRLV